jgi:hypothetical protein
MATMGLMGCNLTGCPVPHDSVRQSFCEHSNTESQHTATEAIDSLAQHVDWKGKCVLAELDFISSYGTTPSSPVIPCCEEESDLVLTICLSIYEVCPKCT